MQDSYEDVEAPCLWKREEAWDPHPAAEDQVPRDLVGKPQERWHRERPVSTTKKNQDMFKESFTIKACVPDAEHEPCCDCLPPCWHCCLRQEQSILESRDST